MTQTEIYINRISQDKVSLTDGISWFKALDKILQKEVIELLIYYILQSHPDNESLELGLRMEPIMVTMTPVVLLKTNNNLKVALDKILALPDYEIKKSFAALICVFKSADQKRRETSCKNGCSHEWHNLSD
jgi:hypothetical protein